MAKQSKVTKAQVETVNTEAEETEDTEETEEGEAGGRVNYMAGVKRVYDTADNAAAALESVTDRMIADDKGMVDKRKTVDGIANPDYGLKTAAPNTWRVVTVEYTTGPKNAPQSHTVYVIAKSRQEGIGYAALEVPAWAVKAESTFAQRKVATQESALKNAKKVENQFALLNAEQQLEYIANLTKQMKGAAS